MKITISKDIKSITEKFNVGVLECNVEIYNDINIEDLMIKMEQEISNNINIEDVVNLDIIIDGRNAYKKYGKDPSRYRFGR